MQNIFIDNYKELIKKLENLKSHDYLFRGQRDALNWKLSPKIFRKDELDKYIRNSLHYSNFCNQINFMEWSHGEELKEFVSLWLKQKLVYNKFPLPIKRLFQIGEFLLKYNCFLSLYIKNIKDYDFGSETKRILSIICGVDWLTKQQFIRFIQYALPQLFNLTALNGSFEQKANLDNLITGYDQTYPQHYDFPTSALDFTRRFAVAIYFALNTKEPVPLHVSKCFSIYAYKELSSSTSHPLSLLKDESILKNNQRAIAQNGTFIFFNRPLDFFLETGRFPMIEDYQSDPSFDIIKINVPFEESLIEDLNALLVKEKINSKTLRLEAAAKESETAD